MEKITKECLEINSGITFQRAQRAKKARNSKKSQPVIITCRFFSYKNKIKNPKKFAVVETEQYF